MSKKITSLMVFSTALLLSMPVKAQHVLKKTKSQNEVYVEKQKRLAMEGSSSKNSYNGTSGQGNNNQEPKVLLAPQQNAKSEGMNAGKIESLPYFNSLSTPEELRDFTIIDANNDNVTWYLLGNDIIYNGVLNKENADDWFVSPSIKLESGKHYYFTNIAIINHSPYGSKYPTLEIKIASANDAKSLEAGSTIIEKGELIVDTLTIFSWQNGHEYENKSITVAETGYYHIGIHATDDWGNGFKLKDFFLSDGSVPAAVTDLSVIPSTYESSATISFTAPTKDLSGYDISSNITKIEITRDGNVIKTFENIAKGTKLSYEDIIGAEGQYTYEVVSYNTAGPSIKNEKVTVTAQDLHTPPFLADLGKENTFYTFSQIDNNKDGKGWIYNWDYDSFSGYAGMFIDCDDYLVSPSMRLDADKYYYVTANVGMVNLNLNTPVYFEVVAGNTPTVEGLNNTVIEKTELTQLDCQDFEARFKPSETNRYHFAIHGMIADIYGKPIKVRSLNISKGYEPNSPDAPIVKVIPAEKGARKATVNVTAPSKDILGNDLGNNISKIEVYRDGMLIKTFEGVKAGETLSFEDTEGITDGFHNYQAIPYDAAGESGRENKAVRQLVGYDVPALPENVTVNDKGTSIVFNWDRVTEGENGGYIDPEEVEYKLVTLKLRSFEVQGYTYYIFDTDKEIASLTDKQSYEYSINTEEGEQRAEYYAIKVQGKGGVNNGFAGKEILLGAPFELPLDEDFERENLDNLHIWDMSSILISPSTNPKDGDYAMNYKGKLNEEKFSYFSTGKLNLRTASEPILFFDAYKAGPGAYLSIYGSIEGDDMTLIKNIDLTDEYRNFMVPLESLKDGRYAQVFFALNYEDNVADSVIIDNIKIIDYVSDNIGVSIYGPQFLLIGDKATLTTNVKNLGKNTANGYNLTVNVGDMELFNKDIDEPLASLEGKTFKIDFEPTVFDKTGIMTVTAKVTPMVDMIEKDNTDEMTIDVEIWDVAAPENADVNEDGNEDEVTVTWEAPTNPYEGYIENFEDREVFVPFSTGGVKDGTSEGSFGEWTIYDSNQIRVNGFKDFQYENQCDVQAWQVFDVYSFYENSYFDVPAPLSGYQYLISFNRSNAEANNIEYTDHWLISPELSGKAQTILFHQRRASTYTKKETTLYTDNDNNNNSDDIDDNYNTKKPFEVLYSTTNRNVESFKPLEFESMPMVGADTWEEVSAELPEGAKYFAIRHYDNSQDALMIDDIIFRKASKIMEYNIYVDGKFRTSVNANNMSEVLSNIEGGQSFAVTAVYESGRESRPAIATLVPSTTAINAVTEDTDKPVNIYTIDGKLVRKNATNLDGLKGLYIINDKKVIIK